VAEREERPHEIDVGKLLAVAVNTTKQRCLS
jgi:hypothetical protein